MSDRARRNRAAQRRARKIRRAVAAGGALLVVGLIVVIALAVRGDDADAGPPYTALGKQGKEAAVRNACVGCHGRSGEGGLNNSGPAWVGLYGSTVELDDGSTVVADRAYLIESIVDPHAKQRAGYRQKMPVDAIAPSDVQAIVAYIEELATPAPTTP
jgi:cytochrome c oxidase subunit 2